MIISFLCLVKNTWHWHSRNIWKWDLWISSQSISQIFTFIFFMFDVNWYLFVCKMDAFSIIWTYCLELLIKCLKLLWRSFSIVKGLINFFGFESLTIIFKDCRMLDWLFRSSSISSGTSWSIPIHLNDSFVV